MSLASGARLGLYEISAAIGAGAMGEVYRATDTKLGRQVAIKVLPAEVAGESERLAREIEPRDPVGVYGVDRVLVTRDGRSYACSYQQFLSDLFVVEGLR